MRLHRPPGGTSGLDPLLDALDAVLAALDRAVVVMDGEGRFLVANAAATQLHGLDAAGDVPRTSDEVRSRFEVLDADGRPLPPARGLLTGAAAGEGPRHLELRLRDRTTGQERVYRYSSARVDLPPAGGPLFVVSAEDVTERLRVERARQDAERRLRLVLEELRFGTYEYDIATGEVSWSAETYRQFGLTPGTPVRHETFAAAVHPDDRARVLAQGAAAMRGENEARYAAEYRAIGVEDAVERWIASWGRVLHDAAGRPTWMFGISLEVTERVRDTQELRASREQLRRLAARIEAVQEEEQARIARDLHDEMGQLLTALKLELHGLEDTVDAECAQAGCAARLLERAVAASELADRALAAVRRVAGGLRPDALDELGLAAALEACGRSFGARSGARCDVHLDAGVPPLDPDRATAVYRMVQEALTNVARHARARQAVVSVERAGGDVVVRVQDDGRGPGDPRPSEGLGIVGMRERAERLGGALSVDPRPGGGTVVSARIPLGS